MSTTHLSGFFPSHCEEGVVGGHTLCYLRSQPLFIILWPGARCVTQPWLSFLFFTISGLITRAPTRLAHWSTLMRFSCACVPAESLQLCLTLCDPMDCSPLGSYVHGILQARIWSGFPFPPPGDLSDSGIKPRSPALAGGYFTTESAEMTRSPLKKDTMNLFLK